MALPPGRNKVLSQIKQDRGPDSAFRLCVCHLCPTPFPRPAWLHSSLPLGAWWSPDSRLAWPLPYTPALMADRFTTSCIAACCVLSPALWQNPLLHGSFLKAASLLSLSLSVHPYFNCSARNFLCDLISGPSYDVLLLPVPLYLLPSFSCHF